MFERGLHGCISVEIAENGELRKRTKIHSYRVGERLEVAEFLPTPLGHELAELRFVVGDQDSSHV